MSLADPATQVPQSSTTQHPSAGSTSQHGTVTPPNNILHTPQLSSPDTPNQPYSPHAYLQTPGGPQRRSITVMDTAATSAGDAGGFGAEDGLGLGYGLDSKDTGGFERAEDISDVSVEEAGNAIMGVEGPAQATTADTIPMVAAKEKLRSPLDLAEMLRMKERLDVLAGGEAQPSTGQDTNTELVEMSRALLHACLEQMPFLQAQLSAQRETIATLQEQAHLAGQLQRIERERFMAERASWQAETRALTTARDNEIASGAKPRGVLDLDVGYHQALEASNKRLEMDNQLMAPRLADTQRQIDKLVNELRYLRSQVILPQAVKDEISESKPAILRGDRVDPLVAQAASTAVAAPTKVTETVATLGDARAEHILLAARKVRSMRAADDKIGRVSLDELKRGGVVGPSGGVGYAEGYGETIADDIRGEEREEEAPFAGEEEDELFDEDELRPIATSKGRSRPANSLLPRPKKGGKARQPPTTPKTARVAAPTTTPGGSNFNDLLRAAELATRPATPSPDRERAAQMSLSNVSASRSTTRGGHGFADELGIPSKTPGHAWTPGRRSSDLVGDAGADAAEIDLDRTPRTLFHTPRQADRRTSAEHEESALDILAQASQLGASQEAGSSQLGSASRLGGVMASPSDTLSSGAEGALAPAIDLRRSPTSSTAQVQQIDPSLTSTPRIPQSPSAPRPAETPKSHKRRLSTAMEFATPSRKVPASSQDTPFNVSPSVRSPPSSAARSESATMELPISAYASPTGATVPGLGKYVHLTSNMPARRIRSPYLKWTVEEDELLARAVAIHGEKWDLVSKGVPTRSYHQVRQRWLRKTGAFDKKMPSAEEAAAAGHADRGEEPTSPTPLGRTPAGKKRKV